MRPAIVAVLFFLSVPAFFVYGVLEQRFLSSMADPVVTKTAAEKRRARIETFAKSWSAEPVYASTFSALSPLGAAVEKTDGPVFDPDHDYWGLPEGEGRDLVSGFCAGCHSLQIVMQQRATRARWVYMLDWMEKKQNMPPLDADSEAMVVDYLVANFGPSGGP